LTSHIISKLVFKACNCVHMCLTKHHTKKTYCESGGIAPRIFDISTRRSWVFRFTSRSVYSRERNPCTYRI